MPRAARGYGMQSAANTARITSPREPDLALTQISALLRRMLTRYG
jgi:hypothetical protein